MYLRTRFLTTVTSSGISGGTFHFYLLLTLLKQKMKSAVSYISDTEKGIDSVSRCQLERRKIPWISRNMLICCGLIKNKENQTFTIYKYCLMKFLFIVQGEGRGHLTQAITLEEILRRNGHEIVEVLVGKSNSRRLPGFFNRSIHAPVKRFVSPNFLPAPANKRVSLLRSVVYNLLKIPTYINSINFIRRCINVSGADMVINFYELLTGMTYLLFRLSVPQVCIGHQYLFLHKDFEFPEVNRLNLVLLKFFTVLTGLGAKERLALSFRYMEDDTKNRIRVIPPLLRKEVTLHEPDEGNYIHGYMLNSGFGEDIMRWHETHPDIPLRFFWDKWEEESVKKIDSTLSFYQLDDIEFLRQMAGCKAYAGTAGFESVCEAMYLGKPVLMVPVHIEQDCNAYDALQSGAGIIASNFELQQLLEFAEEYRPNQDFVYWVRSVEYTILNLLENDPSDYLQTCCNDMYLVEEFI